MNIQYTKLGRWLILAFEITSLSAVGCGGDGLGERYSVSGQVTYKGTPVKSASIVFVPQKEGERSASGTIEDGYYSLTTLTPGDGAFPGTYKVVIDDRKADSQGMQADADALAKKRGVTYNVIPQELQIKAAKKSKGTLPVSYRALGTTKLQQEIQARSNTINIDLQD